MKLLVPIKRVVDYNVKVRPKVDGSGVDLEHVKMAMNPFDEIAVEEAIRLKESGQASEVIVVSVGSNKAQETLRTALAMGADRAILIEHESELEPLNIAKLLAKIVEQEQPRVIILGKQSIDGDHNQTGQMLAALLDYPQATFAFKIHLNSDEITVVREIDGGLESLQLQLPAVVTTDLRLNQPRYVALPNIMKARQKPLQVVSAESLGLTLKSHVTLLKAEVPKARKAGIKVNSVTELIEKLRHEAGVI